MGLENVYYLLVNPTACFKGLEEKRSLSMAFFVVLLAIMSHTVGTALIGTNNLTTARMMLTIGLLTKIIGFFVIWMVMASLLHFFAECLQGKGRVSILFIGLGFSLLPASLITPLALIAQVVGGEARMVIFALSNLFILLWIVRLQITSIKEIYSLSTFRSVVVLTAPLTLMLLLIGLIVLMLLLLTTSIPLVSRYLTQIF